MIIKNYKNIIIVIVIVIHYTFHTILYYIYLLLFQKQKDIKLNKSIDNKIE